MQVRKAVTPVRSVLIFGGAGFIGSNWAHHLLKTSAARVHVFDNLSRPGVQHNLEWLQKNVPGKNRLQITIGDIRNPQAVRKAVHSATEIYHFAAQVAVTTSLEDPQLDFDVNLCGTLNILEAARQTGRYPFLLFTSTNKVYGNFRQGPLTGPASRFNCSVQDCVCESQPLDFHSPYGCSKGAADQYVRDYARIFDLPTVVFRMSCIAGPRQFGTEDQGWVAHFIISALTGQPITIYGNGKQVRDILFVDDLVRALRLAVRCIDSVAGEVFNIGGGPSNTLSVWAEFRDFLRELTGKELSVGFEDWRPGDQPCYVSNIEK